MAYATYDDVTARYRPVTTMVGTGEFDVTTAEVASVYLAQAEAYVDGYLANRYQVPLTVASPLITQVTADLAIFHLLAEKLPQVPEFMDKRKDRCDDILKMLSDGKMRIQSATLVGSSGDSYAWSSNMGYTPVFSPVLDDKHQRVDPDRVEADLVARDYDTVNDHCG